MRVLLVLVLGLVLLAGVEARSFREDVPIPKSCLVDNDCRFDQFCTVDGTCALRDEFELPRTILYSRPMVVGVSLAVGVALLVLTACISWFSCGPGLSMCCNENRTHPLEEGDIFGIFIVIIISVVVFVMGTVGTGLAIGFVEHTPTPPDAPMGSANCTYLWALACGPYSCDMAAARCRTSCRGIGECATSYECIDNACVPSVAGKTVPMPGWAAAAIALGFAVIMAIMCVAIAGGLVVCAEDTFAWNTPVALGLGCGCFVITALVVGLSLGLSRPQVVTSQYGGEKVPGVSHPQISYGGTIATAVVIPIACCLVCGFCSFITTENKDPGEVEFNAIPVLFCCTIFWCFGLALVLGLPLGLTDHPVTFTDVGAGAVCAAHGPCAPYFCDTSVGKCHTECREDDQCMPGYECQAGSCAIPDGTGVTTTTLNGGIVTVIALASGLIILPCCYFAIYEYIDSVSVCGYSKLRRKAFAMASCICVLVVIIVGLAVGLSGGKGHSSKTDPASHCTALQSVACEPYFCDIHSSKCFTGCDSDVDCMDSTACKEGSCLPKDQFEPRSMYRFSWWMGIPVAMTLFLVCFVCVLYSGACAAFGCRKPNIMSDDMDEKEDTIIFFFIMAVMCAIATALVVGLPMSYIRDQAPTSLSCKYDDSCPPGYDCKADVCIATGKAPAVMSKGGAAGVAIGGAIMVVVCFLSCSVGFAKATEVRNTKYQFELSPPILGCCSVFLFLAAVLALGLSLGLTSTKFPYLSVSPAGVPATQTIVTGNTTTMVTNACVGSLASKCRPYLCDTVTEACRDTCTNTRDCVPGYRCDDSSHCVPSIYDTMFRKDWNSYTIVFSVFFGGLAVCMIISFLTGARPRMAMMYGIDFKLVPAICCCTMLFTAVIAMAVSGPLLELKFDFIPDQDGSGATCDALWQPLCAPYSCDVGLGRCQVACTVNRECSGPYTCDATLKKCVYDDGSNFSQHISITAGIYVGLLLIIGVYPALRRWFVRTTNARISRQVARQEAQKKEITDAVARARGDHMVVLDIDPAAGWGYDPTLPTPMGAFAGGGSGGSIFEAAFDQALAGQALGGQQGGGQRRPTSGSGAGVQLSPLSPGGRPRSASTGVGQLVTTPHGYQLPVLNALTGEVVALPSYTEAISPNGTTVVPILGGVPPRRGYTNNAGGNQTRTTDEICSVCFTDPATVRLAGKTCRHGFCPNCAAHSLQAIMDEGQFPARCPGCRAEDPNPQPNDRSFIQAGIVEFLAKRGVLIAEFSRRFINMMILRAFAPHEVISCPVCTMLNTTPDLLAKRNLRGKDPYRVECAECNFAFCCKCNVLYHGHRGLTCEQYALKQQDDDARMTANLINSSSKPCPNCGIGITHYRNHACHHIRPGTGCPNCGIHFCYVCLGRYPCSGVGHDLFCDAEGRCGCPLCPDCKPGQRCPHCDGCPSCR